MPILNNNMVRRSRFDDGGYIMVVLLIGLAVASVWAAALIPAWKQQAQREKEAELIFRGLQYQQAIENYKTKNNNQLPIDVDQLVSGRYLRKKWKDPITGKDFAPTPGQTQNGVGVVTYKSASTAASIKVYNNQQEYDLWDFQQGLTQSRPPAPRPAGQQQGPGGRPTGGPGGPGTAGPGRTGPGGPGGGPGTTGPGRTGAGGPGGPGGPGTTTTPVGRPGRGGG